MPAASRSRSSCVVVYSLGAVVLVALLAAPSASASTERETHLRFYWHDVMSGASPTVARVAEAATTNASATSFGAVYVTDDPLTDGPDLAASTVVGRAQGMYVCAGRDSLSLLMAMTFVFADGSAYNGSSVAVVGPNQAAVHIRLPLSLRGRSTAPAARRCTAEYASRPICEAMIKSLHKLIKGF